MEPSCALFRRCAAALGRSELHGWLNGAIALPSGLLAGNSGHLVQGECSQSCDVSHFQQLRHLHARSLYSAQTGRSRPQPWPVLERFKVADSNAPPSLKWHQTIIRPPTEVSIAQHDNVLVMTGRAGSVKVDLEKLDPTGLVGFKLLNISTIEDGKEQVRPSLVISSPHKDRFTSVVDLLENRIQGVMQGFMVALTVKGVGYRLEPVDSEVTSRTYFFEKPNNQNVNITYPYNKPVKAVRLRVGYSRPVVFPLPEDVRAFCIRPTLMYLYGLQEDKLNELAQQIRAIRKPNVYTGNGIQLVGEALRTKQRSSRKGK